MASSARIAGIELGGTKSIAVLAHGDRIAAQETIPTASPEETLLALNALLRRWDEEQPLDAIGIASFGPVCVDPEDRLYGTILPTPKPGWANAPVAESLMAGLDRPWLIDTDVNAAALAEYRWGAAQGAGIVCYITIGTGIGGGLLVEGRPVHGMMHPEIGHLRFRRPSNDAFPGVCPFHGDCIEGLVSGPALERRFAMPPAQIPDDDPRWRYVVADLTELVCAILLTTSAERILFGGTVALSRPHLLPRIREAVTSRLESYLPFFANHGADRIIDLAGLGARAGPMGAIALGHAALAQASA